MKSSGGFGAEEVDRTLGNFPWRPLVAESCGDVGEFHETSQMLTCNSSIVLELTIWNPIPAT